MYITFTDFIRFCLFVVALISLCHQIFKDEKNQPPLFPAMTASLQLVTCIGRTASGFPVTYNISLER